MPATTRRDFYSNSDTQAFIRLSRAADRQSKYVDYLMDDAGQVLTLDWSEASPRWDFGGAAVSGFGRLHGDLDPDATGTRDVGTTTRAYRDGRFSRALYVGGEKLAEVLSTFLALGGATATADSGRPLRIHHATAPWTALAARAGLAYILRSGGTTYFVIHTTDKRYRAAFTEF